MSTITEIRVTSEQQYGRAAINAEVCHLGGKREYRNVSEATAERLEGLTNRYHTLVNFTADDGIEVILLHGRTMATPNYICAQCKGDVRKCDCLPW